MQKYVSLVDADRPRPRRRHGGDRRRAQRAGERVDLRQVREQLRAHLRGQPWRPKNQELQEVREWC